MVVAADGGLAGKGRGGEERALSPLPVTIPLMFVCFHLKSALKYSPLTGIM